MTEERTIKLDRLRYTKNTASSRLVYLAILLDVFFFVSIYKSDVGSYYYNILIGASILYNLIFMLAAFLAIGIFVGVFGGVNAIRNYLKV